MKNLFYKIAAVILVTGVVTSISCQKATVKNPASSCGTVQQKKSGFNTHRMLGDTNSITIVDNRVVFKTFNDYLKLDKLTDSELNAFAGNLNAMANYTSYAKNWTNLHDSIPDSSALGNEPFLRAILNPYLIVQIDKFIIKLDTHGISYALDAKYSNEIMDLIAENLNNPHIMAFNNTDNGIELLQRGVLGTRRNIGNPDSTHTNPPIGCPGAPDRYNAAIFNYSLVYREKCDLEYHPFLIWFNLYANIKSETKFLFLWISLPHSLWATYVAHYSVKCAKANAAFNFCNTCYSYTWDYTATIYHSVGGSLSSFTVDAVFYDQSVPLTTPNFHIQY